MDGHIFCCRIIRDFRGSHDGSGGSLLPRKLELSFGVLFCFRLRGYLCGFLGNWFRCGRFPAPGQQIAGRRFNGEHRVLCILSGSFDLDPDALHFNAAAGSHIALYLLLQVVHGQRDADSAGNCSADTDQQAVPLVFKPDSFRPDLAVLLQASLHHGFHSFQGNRKIAAFKLLQDKLILPPPVPEKHQQAVQSDDQECSGDHAENDFLRRCFRSQQFFDIADHIHAEESLCHQAGADGHQDQPGKGYQNTVQYPDSHILPLFSEKSERQRNTPLSKEQVRLLRQASPLRESQVCLF